MHFLSADLEKYIADHSANEPEVLQELTRETHLKVVQPRMITGHFQGRVLSMLSKLIAPKRILEIGTYTGYSAICLAEGLTTDGKLHTVDINEELVAIQRKYFDKSGFGHKIVQHTGDAVTLVPKLQERFDLIFIDAEKIAYDRFFEVAMTKATKGAVILSDNVLWSGKVIGLLKPSDKATQALLAYNKKLKEDPRLETVLLPIRDGLTLSRVR